MTALAGPTTATATASATAGAAVHPSMALTLRLQAAAPVRSPLRAAAVRVAGGDPVVPQARSAFTDAVGAHDVGRRLARLTGDHHVIGPHVIGHHVIGHPVVDAANGHPVIGHPVVGHLVVGHLVVGPCGVVVVTPAPEPGSRVTASGSSFTVDGQRLPLLRTARHQAQRVQELLSAATGRPVPVSAVVAVVGAERLTLTRRPGEVAVVAAARLVRWLRRRPVVLDAAAVTAVAAAAADPGTWSAATAPAGDGTGDATNDATHHGTGDAAAFEDLLRRVRAADRVRQAWLTAAAVAGSTSVVVALLDLLG